MSDGHNAIEGTATDPVCGMSVKMDGARFIDRHEGGDHYFCSSRCLISSARAARSGAHARRRRLAWWSRSDSATTPAPR